MAVSPPGRGFCSGAAGSVPVPRILCQRRRHRFSSWLQVALIYNRRRSLHGALPEGRGTQTRFGQGHPPLCRRGGAHGSFANRVHGALPEGRGAQTRFGQGHPAPLPEGRGARILFKQGVRALCKQGARVLCRDGARGGRLRKAGAEGIRRRVQKKRVFSRGKSDIFFYFCINWENSELKCRSCMTRRM